MRQVVENRIFFTEESNAIDYLEKAHCFLTLVKQKPTNWKWVILALHGALYGFLVCACQGKHRNFVYRGVNPTKPNSDEADYEEEDFELDSDESMRLESIYGLLRKCQSPEIMDGTVNSKPLCLKGSQQKSIDAIVKYRNIFAHHKPITIIIYTVNFPRVLTDVLDVILYLTMETNTNVHVMQESGRIEKLIHDCKKILQEMN